MNQRALPRLHVMKDAQLRVCIDVSFDNTKRKSNVTKGKAWNGSSCARALLCRSQRPITARGGQLLEWWMSRQVLQVT
jgi:hypothetical protein